MNELITIHGGGQGSRPVSARELYTYLEIKSRFNDWFKNRVITYKFEEGTDYVEVEGFTKNLVKPIDDGFSDSSEKGGRPGLDYAITLDMAKQLSMVERNDKGKAARLYFINAEKALRQVIEQPLAPAPTTEQVLIQLVSQSNQLLANQQQQLSQLRADVDQIMATGHRPPTTAPRSRPGKQLSVPGVPPAPGQPLRRIIAQRVAEYAGIWGSTTQETYNHLYKRMFDVYGVTVYRLQRIGNEQYIDALERYGLLDKLYSIVMSELNYTEE